MSPRRNSVRLSFDTLEDRRVLTAPVTVVGGPYVGFAGLPVPFDASGSTDSDGTIVKFEWDWEGDGTYDLTTTAPYANHIYAAPFTGQANVRTTDDAGESSIGAAEVFVNNAAVVIQIDTNDKTAAKDEYIYRDGDGDKVTVHIDGAGTATLFLTGAASGQGDNANVIAGIYVTGGKASSTKIIVKTVELAGSPADGSPVGSIFSDASIKTIELYNSHSTGVIDINGSIDKIKTANVLGGSISATIIDEIEIQGSVLGPLTVRCPNLDLMEVWGDVNGKVSVYSDLFTKLDLRGDINAELFVRANRLKLLEIDGTVFAPLNLEVDLLDRLAIHDARANITVGNIAGGFDGNVGEVTVGKLIGSTFRITGDVQKKLSTKSAKAVGDDLTDKMLVLKNALGEADGLLQIDGLTNAKKVSTK